ncbi:MAG: hypothetical protein AB8B51_16375 [Sedimentitalea sp.]
MFAIYALWAHPRSMSTATERIMRERGDLDCAHEPFMYDYYVHRAAGQMPHFDIDPNHPQSYADIRDMLMARAQKGPVFLKDMSYYVMPHILEDADFLAHLKHAFLVRDPVAALISYHRIDPNMSLEEIGIAAQWTMFQALQQQGGTPAVIVAEDVQGDPHGVLGKLWAHWGLAPANHAFDWDDTAPKDWAQVEGWHSQVIQSGGILPPDKTANARAQAAFETTCAQNPHLRSYLAHHLPAYQNLCAHRL